MARLSPAAAAADVPDDITLRSPAFKDGEVLTMRYTCDGTNANPPLRWSEVPDGTAELVLVMEDEHADGEENFVHWMVAGLDPLSGGIDEDDLPEGATVGTNDHGHAGYRGPCPEHGAPARNYVFTLMATRERLDLPAKFDVEQLRMALDGLVLAKGEIIGRYGRTELGTGPQPPNYSG